MFGFILTMGCAYRGRLLAGARELACGDVRLYYRPLPKFERDHLFFEDAERLVLLDGVVFNKAELLRDYGESDWARVFLRLYAEEGAQVAARLRGSFCGAVYEKATGRLLAFTNQSGEKTVYYGSAPGRVFLASHGTLLAELLREEGLPVEPELENCRQLMLTGSILHGGTPVAGLRRLTAGKYLLWEKGRGEERRYHMFRNVPEHEMSLDACIDELDRRFRKAIDRIYGKNREYGYQAECDLSAGLDSRLATWVAHELGYRDILNVCYCQKGKMDNRVSRKIAADLGNEYYFLPLNGGDFLTEIDETTGKFGGQATYLVCTGANRALKEIARHDVGLCVTGLLGEIHNAYWVEGERHTPPAYTPNRYSHVVPLAVPASWAEGYDNFEQMNLYEYSFALFMSSALVRQQQFEVTSPFVDVDFLEFAYRVPLKWRLHYGLTMNWMVKKYPACAEYLWQTKRMPVSNALRGEPYFPKLLDDGVNRVKGLCNRGLRLLHIPAKLTYSNDMNPFDAWYCNKPGLRRFVAAYYSENLPLVRDAALRADIERTFREGEPVDKLQALALLAVFKLYFAKA